jgi:hypothetical protein
MQSETFWSSQHQGTMDSSNGTTWGMIPNFPQINFKLHFDSQVLITLTVPDTWNDTQGAWTWFGINLDGSVIASGLNSMAANNQRVPVALSTVVSLKAGAHSVDAMWQMQSGTGYVGETGTACLTVRAFPNIV